MEPWRTSPPPISRARRNRTIAQQQFQYSDVGGIHPDSEPNRVLPTVRNPGQAPNCCVVWIRRVEFQRGMLAGMSVRFMHRFIYERKATIE